MLVSQMNAKMQGRATLLKISQSLSFYDQNLKRIVNENLYLVNYMQRVAQSRKERQENDQNDQTDESKEN